MHTQAQTAPDPQKHLYSKGQEAHLPRAHEGLKIFPWSLERHLSAMHGAAAAVRGLRAHLDGLPGGLYTPEWGAPPLGVAWALASMQCLSSLLGTRPQVYI